jgi:hypothetical protein
VSVCNLYSSFKPRILPAAALSHEAFGALHTLSIPQITSQQRLSRKEGIYVSWCVLRAPKAMHEDGHMHAGQCYCFVAALFYHPANFATPDIKSEDAFVS